MYPASINRWLWVSWYRAYKLGKGKCSYNQVELVFKLEDPRNPGDGSQVLEIEEAIEIPVGNDVEPHLVDSCLKYKVQFKGGYHLKCYLFLVYATCHGTTWNKQGEAQYHWVPVTRNQCQKGCSGPLLRGLQRFGKLPRRNSWSLGDGGVDASKDPKKLYIAVDEASNHMNKWLDTTLKFRLLLATFTEGQELVGSSVSSSLRVLSNNDTPLGSASFQLPCTIRGMEEQHAQQWQRLRAGYQMQQYCLAVMRSSPQRICRC